MSYEAGKQSVQLVSEALYVGERSTMLPHSVPEISELTNKYTQNTCINIIDCATSDSR